MGFGPAARVAFPQSSFTSRHSVARGMPCSPGPFGKRLLRRTGALWGSSLMPSMTSCSKGNRSILQMGPAIRYPSCPHFFTKPSYPGRLVVITSDHGHVLSIPTPSAHSGEGGERWRNAGIRPSKRECWLSVAAGTGLPNQKQ